MKETVKRSLAKTISWRITASLTTFIVAWILTGDYIIGSSIALVEALVKIFLYYFHERGWNLITWGNK